MGDAFDGDAFDGDAFDGDGDGIGSAGADCFAGEDVKPVAGVDDSIGGAVSLGLDGFVVALLSPSASNEDARLGRLPVD